MKKQTIQIRLSDDEKEAFVQAAAMAGVSLSSWVRERLRSSAIRELEVAGMQAPFVKPLHMAGNNDER